MHYHETKISSSFSHTWPWSNLPLQMLTASNIDKRNFVIQCCFMSCQSEVSDNSKNISRSSNCFHIYHYMMTERAANFFSQFHLAVDSTTFSERLRFIVRRFSIFAKLLKSDRQLAPAIHVIIGESSAKSHKSWDSSVYSVACSHPRVDNNFWLARAAKICQET